ncbi:hypothetical protein ACFS32_01765 [Novosphingobium pokkalii]|uniref:hypothetical protein n=1 Tax=Novosphingobium pokkalii TaxID=1770194 RepID=UPI00363A5732
MTWIARNLSQTPFARRSTLYRWREYAGSVEEPRAWIAREAEADAGLAGLIERFMRSGSSQSVEDRVSTTFFYFEKIDFTDFFDDPDLRARVARLDASALSEGQAKARATLIEHFEKWADETGKAKAPRD